MTRFPGAAALITAHERRKQLAREITAIYQAQEAMMQQPIETPAPGTCDAIQAAASRRKRHDVPSSEAVARAIHAGFDGDQRAIAAWLDNLTEALAGERQRDTADAARRAGL